MWKDEQEERLHSERLLIFHLKENYIPQTLEPAGLKSFAWNKDTNSIFKSCVQLSRSSLTQQNKDLEVLYEAGMKLKSQFGSHDFTDAVRSSEVLFLHSSGSRSVIEINKTTSCKTCRLVSWFRRSIRMKQRFINLYASSSSSHLHDL